MEWLIRALSAIREVRDWADAPSSSLGSPGVTDGAGHEHTEVPALELSLEPIGPAIDPALGKQDLDGRESMARKQRDGAQNSKRPPATPQRTANRRGEPARSEEARPRRPARKTEDRTGPQPNDNPVQEIPLELIDPHALEVIRRLRRFGYRAYLVGGCVRDLLLGLKPKDFDIATSARPGEVRALFRNSRLVGRRFRLALILFRNKMIEVSTFRATPVENEPAENDGVPEAPASEDLLVTDDNVFGTAEEDARRRDFTVNALFYDVTAGRVVDHVRGMRDLHARRLRTIGDPEVRMREDPVRLLRAV